MPAAFAVANVVLSFSAGPSTRLRLQDGSSFNPDVLRLIMTRHYPDLAGTGFLLLPISRPAANTAKSLGAI
jgi:hypothetical protein